MGTLAIPMPILIQLLLSALHDKTWPGDLRVFSPRGPHHQAGGACAGQRLQCSVVLPWGRQCHKGIAVPCLCWGRDSGTRVSTVWVLCASTTGCVGCCCMGNANPDLGWARGSASPGFLR